MSLQIEHQETENRELKLTVRVDESRVQEQIRQTAKKLGKKLRVPGFRPGKAPFHIVQRWVGPEALRGEAVESLTDDIYKEALEQADVNPFAPGSLDDMEMDPLVLYLTIPLEPSVDLGDYRQVRADPPEVEITDEQVDAAMKEIQDKHALLEPADRPAQEGDVVIADLVAKQDDEVMLDREGAELLLDPETLYPDIPFVEHVVGMSAGEEKSFEISVPADDDADDADDAADAADDAADAADAAHDAADAADDAADAADDAADAEGHEGIVSYKVTVHEVKSRYLPPLNDDLAREEGDFETLLELRIDARQRLTEAAQKKADAEYVDQIFDKILEGTTIVYPPAAVEQEIDRTLEEMGQRFEQQGWALEDLLKLQGKTVEMMREELRPQAEEQVTRRQATFALVSAEQLSMSDDELDQVIDDRMGDMGEVDEELGEQLREYYSSGQGRVLIANDMLMNKFTERLKAIGQGEAPELPDLSIEEEE